MVLVIRLPRPVSVVPMLPIPKVKRPPLPLVKISSAALADRANSLAIASVTYADEPGVNVKLA